MKEKVKCFIKENHMVRRGDTVCVGLSGGADSVCLFLILLDLKEELGISLEAFHLNHNLRGQDSLRDEAFVKALCNEKNVRLKLFSTDVAEEARKRRIGLEETGRILRSEIAGQCLSEGCDRVALAHHRNDLAETFLFNLARGCSVNGLAAIRPVSGRIIRPLLFANRQEIESELARRGAHWCTDATNTDETYTRNYIRGTVIPSLEKGVNEKIVDHIYELSSDLARAEEILDEMTGACFDRSVTELHDRFILHPDLTEENPLIVSTVIKRCVERLSGKSKDLSRTNIESVRDLFCGQKGRGADLPFGLRAEAGYEGVTILRKSEEREFEDEIPFIPEAEIRAGGAVIRSEIIPCSPELKEEKNQYTKCFDYDKINRNCVLRTRRPGDRILIGDGQNSKKLKEFFMDRRISSADRGRILLLAEGSTVHWVIGYRMGDSAKITENTEKAVRITVSGEYTDEHKDP
ncbi:MAG: tRNA lysidine(34) synthetase TilS [Lachnospiraceae bacterium]|nr:tRNA lysidine(34) synthetase TilS [Lachnospiraceae bacterium]